MIMSFRGFDCKCILIVIETIVIGIHYGKSFLIAFTFVNGVLGVGTIKVLCL